MSKHTKDIIPSQTALKLCRHSLRFWQHKTAGEAIVHDRAGRVELANEAAGQADDYDQVATFLEKYIQQ